MNVKQQADTKTRTKTQERKNTEVIFSQNTDTKTVDDKEFLKELKRPRTRKRMKLVQQIDVLSMTDEQIIAKMQEESGGALDEASITKEDISAYLAGIKEEFEAMVQRDMEEEERKRKEAEEKARREEEERRRKEAEQRRREEERKRLEEEIYNHTMQYALVTCVIPGCIVHSIVNGYVEHYPLSAIPGQMRNAYEFYNSLKRCHCVEVYPKHMAAYDITGEMIQTKQL